jgi:hypothetical protein
MFFLSYLLVTFEGQEACKMENWQFQRNTGNAAAITRTKCPGDRGGGISGIF